MKKKKEVFDEYDDKRAINEFDEFDDKIKEDEYSEHLGDNYGW